MVSFVSTVYTVEEGEGRAHVCARVTPIVGFPFHINFTAEQDGDAGISSCSISNGSAKN